MQELKAYNVVATADVNPDVVDSLGCTEFAAYDADEVDAVLAEKDAAIAELKANLQNHCTTCPVKEQEEAVLAEKDAEIAELKAENNRINKLLESAKRVENCYRKHHAENKRALWLARAERYKISEFIAREEACLCNQISWSPFLRERTYGQWTDQLLRIANSANKLHNKCRAKAEEYK